MSTQNEEPQIGDLILQLEALNEEAAALAAAEKAKRAEATKLSNTIRDKMVQLGLEFAKAGDTKVSPEEAVYPDVTDWDKFWKYIAESGNFHLLERRPTATGYRELLSLGRVIPGVKPRVVFKLRVTKA